MLLVLHNGPWRQKNWASVYLGRVFEWRKVQRWVFLLKFVRENSGQKGIFNFNRIFLHGRFLDLDIWKIADYSNSFVHYENILLVEKCKFTKFIDNKYKSAERDSLSLNIPLCEPEKDKGLFLWWQTIRTTTETPLFWFATPVYFKSGVVKCRLRLASQLIISLVFFTWYTKLSQTSVS